MAAAFGSGGCASRWRSHCCCAIRDSVPGPERLSLLVLVAVLTYPAIHTFRQGCDHGSHLLTRATLFQTHQGVEPTDEYTPSTRTTTFCAPNDPPYWTASDPRAFAPGTTPNPATAPIPQSQPAAPTNGELSDWHPPGTRLHRLTSWRIARNRIPHSQPSRLPELGRVTRRSRQHGNHRSPPMSSSATTASSPFPFLRRRLQSSTFSWHRIADEEYLGVGVSRHRYPYLPRLLSPRRST